MGIPDFYEIRRGREVLCCGTLKNLGYTKARLMEMYRSGLRLFKNGKVVRQCDL